MIFILELYFAGESLTNDLPHSYTCPFCGKLGFTESTLYEHVIVSHTDISAAVVSCILCSLSYVLDRFCLGLSDMCNTSRWRTKPSFG